MILFFWLLMSVTGALAQGCQQGRRQPGGGDTWVRRAGIWGRPAVARQGFDLGGGVGSLDECGDELVDQILVETIQRAQCRGVLGRFSLGAYVCVAVGQSPVDNLPSLPAQGCGPVLAPCRHRCR